MAITTAISTKELERQAKAVFEGKAYRMFLASRGTATNDDTTATWDALKPTGNGYADVTGVIGTGSYSVANGRYEVPAISCDFTATGTGYTYDTVCLVVDSNTHLYGVIDEAPAVTLAAGATKTYTITLAQDD